MTYKVVRFFFDSRRRYTLERGLTLQAAQAHCKDPETASQTAKGPTGRRRTKRLGPWFDGYYREK